MIYKGLMGEEEVSKLLKMVGFKPDAIPFIPIASLPGDNVAKLTDKMPWYKGKTLVATLDDITLPEKPTGLPGSDHHRPTRHCTDCHQSPRPESSAPC